MPKIKIAAVGDIHYGTDSSGLYRSLFKQVSDEADILVLCGDLTRYGLPEEAECLADDMKICTIPIVSVLGNHDVESSKMDDLRRILSAAKVNFLDEKSFVLGQVGFAGTKGFGGGFVPYALDSFGESSIKQFVGESRAEINKLEDELKRLTTKYKVVVLHYSPTRETLIGEPPEIVPFMGTSKLGDIIDHHSVSLVLHGHSHNGVYSGKTAGGVPVFNCNIDVISRSFPDKQYAIHEIDSDGIISEI